MTYKCIEAFSVPLYDGDGEMTDDHEDIKKGSLWELDDDGGSIIGGEIHLDNPETLDWLEISKKMLKKYFKKVLDHANKPNKVYYFEVDADNGGVYIAAKNLRAARNGALHAEPIVDDIQDYGFLSLKHQCLNVTTTYEGELSCKQLDKLGISYTKMEGN